MTAFCCPAPEVRLRPGMFAVLAAAWGCLPLGAQASRDAEVRPFSSLGLALKVGAEGIGYDAATPLSRRFNLRGGASFFTYSHPLTEHGIQVEPTIQLRKVGMALDWYPWGGSFRISPGVVLHNGNSAHASALVPAGETFDLNDQTYTSSATDPLHGTADLRLGHPFAPSLTFGWGNLIPRSGRHVSVPFEAGFEYIGRPALTYDFAGTACSADGCGAVQDDPQFQANKVAEQAILNKDLAPLRFYPILSVGLGYRF